MLIHQTLSLPADGWRKQATIWQDDAVETRAVLLYLHGGALIYGNRDDLPELHISQLTCAGFAVMTLDYPLAPSASAAEILEDVRASIAFFLEQRRSIFGDELPYFLFGRSAGAYLCLLQLMSLPSTPPAGIVSYYGYALLSPGWFDTPSPFYRRYPEMPEAVLRIPSHEKHAAAELSTHYAAYVLLRQRGTWGSFLGQNAPRLLDCATPDCPLFLAHAQGDSDVPFAEFLALRVRFPDSICFVSHSAVHDFDRDTSLPETQKLLEKTIKFLDEQLLR